MWFFKKKNKQSNEQLKKYEPIKSTVKTLLLKTYQVKIYDFKNRVIGKSCFTQGIDYLEYINLNNNLWGPKCEFPINAQVNHATYWFFHSFNERPVLTFEDYDENEVTMVTSIIKKVVLSVYEENEEEIQLYEYKEIK